MTDRKLGLALTLGIVLEVLEILRRTPPLVLVVALAALLGAVFFVLAHLAWVVAGLVVLLVWRRIGRPRT